ncbi:DUF1566 domain-containing protein, partial [Vibrio vulnificus]
TQQLTATATFSDATSSDVSNSVTWTSDDTNTATVTSAGMLSGVEVGNTTLTATKDGIISNTVDVKVCVNLAGPCIDIFDKGNGKLFTNSPSVAYLDSIGGSATNGAYTESGTSGLTGEYYTYSWNNANALCATYNTHSLGGRTNWRLPSKDELKRELYDVFGNMFTARGWPTSDHYWTASPDGNNYYVMDLRSSFAFALWPNGENYASCVSSP